MAQTLTAHFQKYIRRDTKTGDSLFTVIPELQMEGTENGILRCRGRIHLYASGMPILITGELKAGIYQVSKDSMSFATRKNVLSILGYLDKKLTDTEKNRIADISGNDLYAFCRDKDNAVRIAEALGNSEEKQKQSGHLFRKLRSMLGQWDMEELLLQYNIPFDAVLKICRSGISRQNIISNPYYHLLKQGVSFQSADCFAREEAHVRAYSMERLKGVVMAALNQASAAGHTCLTLGQVCGMVSWMSKSIQPGIPESFALVNSCIPEMPRFCQYHVIGEEAYLYINHVWDEECAGIQGVERLSMQIKRFEQTILPLDTERELGIRYNREQLAAFELLKTSGIKILTGPPGSGKTAILQGLIHNFRANGNGNVVLAATTGMAAKVMSSSTGEECMTVHQMLHIIPYHDSVRGKDINDPVDADLIIVDEVSMMGLQVFSILVQAVRNGSILLLVGDEDQLQSVDYGSILHDLEDSGAAQVCRLKECIRNSGVIFDNALRIRAGSTELVHDARFMRLVLDRSDLSLQLEKLYDADTQIICPVNNGPVSVRSLNVMIQNYVNRDGDIAACYGSRIFRIGDRVIFHKTDYGKGYINGDIGTITDCTEKGDLLISLPEGSLYVSQDDYCNIDLAYAVTVHKSQGSTFRKVIIILPVEAKNMMTRRLLYTAVTRASERVIIFDEQDSFKQAVANRHEIRRTTCLGKRLKMLRKNSQN